MSVRVASDLDEKIESLPANSVIVVRKGRLSPMGLFESVVSVLAKKYGHVVVLCQPDGNDRASVYKRDYEMVENVDRLEAYFSQDSVMNGGTGHLVEAAMARSIPVYAWTLSEHGDVVRVGEYEPHDAF